MAIDACDFDFDLMTLVLKFDLDEVKRSFSSKFIVWKHGQICVKPLPTHSCGQLLLYHAMHIFF